jgi:uncharacterized protein
METNWNKIADGRTDLVFDFIQQGNNPSQEINGTPLLNWCAYYGDVSAVKFLISKGGSLASLGEDRGLINAAFHGHWRLCHFLLEQGADANYRLADCGETVLHAATSKTNNPVYTLIVEILLSYGADPNVETLPRKETGCFMRDTFTRQETPLHRAAAFGDARMIQILLNAGADKTKKDMHGDTPLSWASWHLRPDHILAMLCYGHYRISQERINRSSGDYRPEWGKM